MTRPWLSATRQLVVAAALALAVALAGVPIRPAPLAETFLVAAASALTPYALLTRGRRLRGRRGSRPPAARAALLVSAAFAEETMWRAGAVGALARTCGMATAVAVVAVAFAASHAARIGRRWPLHLVTGASFGVAFAVAGLLAAAAAHAFYNLLVEAMPPTPQRAA